MSNLIPPLLSSTPPPIIGPLDEDDDDEFGDFRAAANSYDCDDLSLPPSPQKSPEKEVKSDLPKVNLDINSNSQKVASTTNETPTQNVNEPISKDFQDRRKSIDETINSSENQVNCSFSHVEISNGDTSSTIFEKNESEREKLEEAPVETNFISSSDQNHDLKISEEDEFADLQCGDINYTAKCDENDPIITLEAGTNKTDDKSQDDLNSFSNEDNLFEEFSESVQLEKSNSDDLSELNETNEIKSEDDCLEEICSELVIEDETKDDKIDDSLKEEISELSLSLKVDESDPKLNDDEFGDFEDHFCTEFKKSDDKQEEQEIQPAEDEFDDFVSPLPPPQPAKTEVDDFGDFASSELTQEEEEFDDFADFSSPPTEKPVTLEIDTKDAVEKSEIILKEIFPVIGKETDVFELIDTTKGNLIFEELKDITETNALLYQWSKSNSQKMFLKALNIDLRNILYGPAWNASMPRFAANLGLTPLEPVKSEILTPTPVQNASSPSNSSQKNNSDIPTAQFDWSGSGLINPLDSASTEQPGNVPEDTSQRVKTDFLPTTSEKSDPIPILFDTTETPQKSSNKQVSTEITSNFDDFTPFQSPKVMIPLRETHISNEIISDFGNKPGWLEPTILTPDLPRKEPIISDLADEDEFDDFQMVLPEEKPKITEVKSPVLPDLTEFMTTKVETVHKPQNQKHIPGLSSETSVQKIDDDDDEFTDFHSHSSLPQPVAFTPLQPVPVEPLKPSVSYAAPAQINWPEPGVTDEDIRNIELTYSRKTEPKAETTKESSLEEEEWSDFVSVNTVKSTERTSTPDLPLSVLNLNSVQAPKQPIPVITPSGLLQTKLSSMQPSNVVQTTMQPSVYKPPQNQFQPSIISNLFPSNGQSQNDDEDWSDFVSSQPLPQMSNGFQQQQQKPLPRPPNWANANIITNPSHFDSFSNYVPQQSKKTAKTAISSISAIPDLEFIAPKSRTKK